MDVIKDSYLNFKKVAVILFNLGGPSDYEEIKPFLFNLFYDKNIIDIPNPFRFFLAKLISTLRYKKSQKIYSFLNNKSPILQITNNQADLLQQKIGQFYKNEKNISSKVFVCMRYAKPFLEDIINDIKSYLPDEVVLLPLYPHYSKTTTGSFLKHWDDVARKNNFIVDTTKIKQYCTNHFFITAHCNLIKKHIDEYKSKFNDDEYVVIFSAHGIPIDIIQNGDPYEEHMKKSVEAIKKELNLSANNYILSYQSRVGPKKWLEPHTESVLQKEIKQNKAIIIVPISFVSENSETLVELDIEYKEIAQKIGCKYYSRVECLNYNEDYINCLSNLIFDLDF